MAQERSLEAQLMQLQTIVISSNVIGYTGIMGYIYNAATTTVRHRLNSGIVFRFGVSFN